TIQQFGDGNLVRVIVPLQSGPGAVVVSSFIPMSLISRMNDVTNAYEEFRNINPLQYPLKSIHLTMLFLMTMVILFAAIWYGFHLARQLSVPLVQLGRATRKVAEGEYATVEVQSGSQEIQLLIDSFNQMTKDLSSSRSKVQETLSYLEVVLKNISAGVISVDSAGRLTTINRRAADLLKIEPDRYIGRPVRELLTIEYFRTFAEMLKTMEENHVDSIQREQQFNINGEVVPLSMSLTILKDEKGDVIGRVLVFDDLTPIVAAQRSAAWSEVARRIAHEIKNPLTPIKMAAERLRRKFGSQIQDPVFDECTTMIVRQTDDLKNLVNEFSNFARLPETRPVTASLNKVIEEAVSVFRASHPEVPIELSLDPALPEFKLDPDQIKRVLMNLLDNGIAAMQGFIGQIKVQTHYDNELKLVRLTVDDEGPGIPGPDRHRIFEPYYSTKKGGTGLGLAIVKRIVEDHNGFIRALSNQPRGTRMLIELPVPVGGGRKPAEGARA
ncbi:MAG: ATP-binding protein, partial [Bdellovibrionaceae bacterium]|nr:ATP-binding protein [Pseudobdellovibrionaceae bacterium]